MAPSSVCDSAVSPCLQGSWLSFISIPTAPSSFRFPQAISLQSTTDLALGLLSNLCVPAPSCSTFQGTCVSVWGMCDCGKDSLCDPHSTQTLTDQLFHSPAASVLHLSRKHLPSHAALSLLQFPNPRCRSSSTHSSCFCPPSFVLLSVAWFYISFSGGQVLSWCSARSSVSGGVFLTYPWREMYSTCTYSSAILDLSVWYRAHTSLQVRYAVGCCPISVVGSG